MSLYEKFIFAAGTEEEQHLQEQAIIIFFFLRVCVLRL